MSSGPGFSLWVFAAGSYAVAQSVLTLSGRGEASDARNLQRIPLASRVLRALPVCLYSRRLSRLLRESFQQTSTLPNDSAARRPCVVIIRVPMRTNNDGVV